MNLDLLTMLCVDNDISRIDIDLETNQISRIDIDIDSYEKSQD